MTHQSTRRASRTLLVRDTDHRIARPAHRGPSTTPRATALVASTIALAQSLDLRMGAKEVENEIA